MRMLVECSEPAQASSLDDMAMCVAMRRSARCMLESALKTNERQNAYGGRNLTTHWTEARVSRSLIVNLSVPTLIARSVNSGVRRHFPY